MTNHVSYARSCEQVRRNYLAYMLRPQTVASCPNEVYKFVFPDGTYEYTSRLSADSIVTSGQAYTSVIKVNKRKFGHRTLLDTTYNRDGSLALPPMQL